MNGGSLSLFTAIVTATIFAAFGFPYRYYQCWWSWGGGRSVILGIAYFALAGGGGGLLGWFIAELGNAHPTKDLALNGFLYGAAGALTLRADFRPRRTPASKPPHPAEVRNAASILAVGLQWTGTALDDVSRRRVEAWLRQLDVDGLIRQAFDINAMIKMDVELPSRTRTLLREQLVAAMEQARSDQTDVRLEGTAHLISFCTTYFIQEHRPRPL